ncbi:FAD binding domain-containing protein [Cohnella faecalis]
MPSYLIDLSAVKELTGIKVKHNRLTIGALTSLAQVRSSAEVLANAPALTAAAAAIAAHSIRQLATIGGNIVTRVGDSLPGLSLTKRSWFGKMTKENARWMRSRGWNVAEAERQGFVHDR